MCKWSDPFSKRVLIGRGLDPIFMRYSICCAVRYSVLRVHPQEKETVGVDDGEVPPVPIPNTEVKLTCAEDSSLETARENR